MKDNIYLIFKLVIGLIIVLYDIFKIKWIYMEISHIINNLT